MADIPVHPFLLQLAQHQVLPIAIIAPLSSSSINEPTRTGVQKTKAD
jgi:hypothetical protein